MLDFHNHGIQVNADEFEEEAVAKVIQGDGGIVVSGWKIWCFVALIAIV